MASSAALPSERSALQWPYRPASGKAATSPKLVAGIVAFARGSQDHRFAAFGAGILIGLLFLLDDGFDMSNVLDMRFDRWF